MNQNKQHNTFRWIRGVTLPITWISICVIGGVTFLNIVSLSRKLQSRLSHPAYTYVDNDFPDYLAVHFGPARMLMQDTVHYGVNGSEAEREWDSTFPRGEGFVHLGAERRRFGLSMFHQMHCLQMIRHALTSGNIGTHTTHCLTYLRLMVLCRVDLQLEPASGTSDESWMDVDWIRERDCKDWEQLYEWIGKNNDDYETWSRSRRNTLL
ncbi:hypothetical protein NEOLEDRAFT_537357 [Neolentinus lepideus HHB14362 ss-1]|uniref:Tat pathway signal sequence n=1 Tax=Neolentinus lepideus HHB14362 ss-1 TaxID=1314782 RepID=A0A165RB66_9AGAM|nr:hypothetical protein NEOLEDRAFT_537357 [Neolentinus lepideus HHB14362 ss-1]